MDATGRPWSVEKSDQKQVEYMNPNEKKLWIDTRLSQEEMVFLNNAISKENKNDFCWLKNNHRISIVVLHAVQLKDR